MARSGDRGRVRRGAVVAAGAAAVGVACAGCATTQDEAARLQLNSARIRVGEVRTRVTAPGDAVAVTHVSLVRTARGSAFVVDVCNRGTEAVSDLPISVGLTVGRGRRMYVNGHSPSEYSYFDAHLPLVKAGGTLTWVYATTSRLASAGRPFALVGDRPEPRSDLAGATPVIDSRVVSAPASGTTAVAISLRNTTSVPQYQLQVYAVAGATGRAVAAGALTVPHLGSHKTLTVKLPVIGRLGQQPLQVAATPTIFR